jgi:hypothetical protein
MSFGEPEDVDGQCNARLFLADNYRDNHCTIRCQLTKGHTGKHLEAFSRETGGSVEIRWVKDERAE